MAEVIKMPKPGAKESAMTREKSTLDSVQHVKAEVIPDEEKGVASAPKKSFGQKLKETFIKEDLVDVKEYVLWEIIVPTIGRTINDIICGTSQRIFLGGPSSSSNLYRERGVTYVRQNRTVSTQKTRQKVETRPLPAQMQAGRSANFECLDLTFDDYAKTQQAFEQMVDYLDTYGQLSVDEYADILAQHFKGVPQPNYTARNWGWTSLSNATIVNASGGGYFIKMPNPVVISER